MGKQAETGTRRVSDANALRSLYEGMRVLNRSFGLEESELAIEDMFLARYDAGGKNCYNEHKKSMHMNTPWAVKGSRGSLQIEAVHLYKSPWSHQIKSIQRSLF